MRELKRRVRDLEGLLGRKTMEVEILREALDLARTKKPTSPLVSWGGSTGGSRRRPSPIRSVWPALISSRA